MFDKKYIAGIASFAGAINNVKAVTDVSVYVNFNGKNYFDASGKIDKDQLSTFDNLIAQLATLTADKVLKKDGSSVTDTLDLVKISDKYFVKSVTVGSTEKLSDITTFNISKETIDDNTNKLTVELVKKEDRVNIKYNDSTVKGGRLTKENEEKILESILQGKKNTEISNFIALNNLEFSFGGNKQDENSKLVGKDLKLFENDNKIDFTISKIPDDGFKTVVCNFADETESKLVKGVDLEKLCDAFTNSGNGLKQANRNLATVLTGLNECQVDSTNDKFFKDLNGVSIKKDGSDITNDKVTDENQKDFSTANFVVVDGIKEENINPIFLKKSFTVEFDNEGNNTKKVDDTILNKIKEALNAKFRDQVAIKVSDITDTISGVKNSKDNDIIVVNAFTNLNAISFEGVNKSGTALVATDVVNSKDITVKLKSEVFAKDIVKTEIKLTCDLANVKKGDKVLTGDVKNIISPILNKTLTEVTAIKDIIDALNAALSGKFADESKQIKATDFDFSAVSSDNTNIKNSGAIAIKESFASKLKDDCFETKKDSGNTDPNKNSEGSKGTNGDGGNQNEGNKDQKGYCGSNKK